MQKLDISFEDLVETYFSEELLYQDEIPARHGLICCDFVFLHEDGKHYFGNFYRSENEGVVEDFGHQCYEVKPVETITVEWVDVDQNVKGIS